MKCNVCNNEKATSYNHYGSHHICLSCRAFFMRSAKLHESFKHSRKGCIIDSTSRKSCKLCRFQKCLQAGMQIKFVQGPKQELCLSNSLTLSESHFLNQLAASAKDTLMQCFFDIFEADLKLAHLIYEELPQQNFTHADLDTIGKLSKVSQIKVYEVIGKQVDLNIHDIHVLAEHNHEKIDVFNSSVSYGKKQDEDHSAEFIAYGKQKRQQNGKVKAIIDLIEQSCQRISADAAEDFHTYEQYYSSPWASDSSIEDEHKSITHAIQDWFFSCEKPGDPGDACLQLVTSMMLLFNTDGLECKKINLSQIRKAQQMSVALLCKILKNQLEQEMVFKRLHQGVMLLYQTERAVELSQKRLQLQTNSLKDDILNLEIMEISE